LREAVVAWTPNDSTIDGTDRFSRRSSKLALSHDPVSLQTTRSVLQRQRQVAFVSIGHHEAPVHRGLFDRDLLQPRLSGAAYQVMSGNEAQQPVCSISVGSIRSIVVST
jgi:hypothetical protein